MIKDVALLILVLSLSCSQGATQADKPAPLPATTEQTVYPSPAIGRPFATNSPASFVPLGKFEEDGPFTVDTNNSTGPNNEYSLYRPADLGQGGIVHPIITWGNGTGAQPAVYNGLLRHLASQGFVVIASHSTMTGTGKEMIAGVDWLIAEDQRAGSPFYQKLNTAAVGATGHSQGGEGALAAGVDPKIICLVAIEPAPYSNATSIKIPSFIIAGSADTIVQPSLAKTSYTRIPTHAVFSILNGASHFTPVDLLPGDREKTASVWKYLTAWFRLHLMNEQSARPIFYGPDCGLCKDSSWVTERKGMD